MFGLPSMTLTELPAAANTLLYVAKRKGRNRVEPDICLSGGTLGRKVVSIAAAVENGSGEVDVGICG